LAERLATPAGQAQVVELAGRLDGAEFGKALAQLSASLDPAMRQRSHDEQRAARSLAWTHTPSGTLIKGRLDAVAGHRFAKVIDALCPRPALEDDRTREQRQADALMAVMDRAATDKTTAPGTLAPVQAIVTFTPDTWTALRATRPSGGDGSPTARPRPGHPGRDDALTPAVTTPPVPGSATDVMGRLRGVDPVVDESGQAWPASEVARALCDCALTWAVVGTPAAELNLGRECRLFKRQHWLALYAAGITTCAVGGCSMPLAYTELHHLAWWQRDNGPTDQANCAPYCSFHHHEIHRLGIAVTRLPDGSLDHRHPDGRRYGAPPAPHDAGGRSLPTDGRSLPNAALPGRVSEDDDGPRDADGCPAFLAPPRQTVGTDPLLSVGPGTLPSAGRGRAVRTDGPPDADSPPDLLALLSA
jgi:hypothetical protein